MQLVNNAEIAQNAAQSHPSLMAIDHPLNWYLRKHTEGVVFGPVRFEQLVTWAQTAQINSHDMVSNDKEVWTKAPMVPDLGMDWMLEVTDNLLYGPTTGGALLEFVHLGEINRDTTVINACTGDSMPLRTAPFFSEEALRAIAEEAQTEQPQKGGIKVNLQQRIRVLEAALIEKRVKLNLANETIAKLEAKILELEKYARDVRSGKK